MSEEDEIRVGDIVETASTLTHIDKIYKSHPGGRGMNQICTRKLAEEKGIAPWCQCANCREEENENHERMEAYLGGEAGPPGLVPREC